MKNYSQYSYNKKRGIGTCYSHNYDVFKVPHELLAPYNIVGLNIKSKQKGKQESIHALGIRCLTNLPLHTTIRKSICKQKMNWTATFESSFIY